jgi:predicted O-methyltransferase YrrM
MIKTIIKNLSVIKNWPIVVRKLKGRLDHRNSSSALNEANNWCKQHASSIEDYMKELDPELYNESIEFSRQHRESAEYKLREIDVQLGGGGNVELLYFLTRLYKPMFCIETGVAAGHSSVAILSGLKKNLKGLLFSSDLP